ncbi:MAG: hypothetical protein O7I93_16865 [Gemmatimonadetes bacterium]|nr:hypothetical protein [Gemmatimonadota bacterium]
MTARQTATIVALATALWEPAGLAQHDGQDVPPPVLAPGEEVAYVCPIHSDYTSEAPGMCPRDGMALMRANPYAVRDYRLEFETVPAVVSVGEPATLRFRIFHPETGEPIRNFLTVHDKQYHLFVVSQDMAHFEHVHPEQEADGAWSIEVTLPRAGYYTVLSDFVPNGGSLQFIARTLVTAGYEGDLGADSARLTADEVSTQSIGNLTATLSYDPAPFVAGLYGHLNFHLTDRLTGRPVTDLQPYLAAFGHTLVLSEDMRDFVHSHPIDLTDVLDDDGGPRLFMLPIGVDPETLRGGPDVTFDGLMPRPGRFRAFTQFRRDDQLHTFQFTFNVVASQ